MRPDITRTWRGQRPTTDDPAPWGHAQPGSPSGRRPDEARPEHHDHPWPHGHGHPDDQKTPFTGRRGGFARASGRDRGGAQGPGDGPGAGFGSAGRGGGPDDGRDGHGGRGGHGHGGPHGPRGPRRGPGSRAGRGDIRGAVLMLLSEQPMHGYQLIQEITERSGGRWTPSPGAIYPALNLLEDEGLVTITADSGRKLASLTPEGTAYVGEHREHLMAPWDRATGQNAHPARALREAMEALGGAAHQIARTGTDEQTAQAVRTLEKARRELYLVLAGETVHMDPTTDEDRGDDRERRRT